MKNVPCPFVPFPENSIVDDVQHMRSAYNEALAGWAEGEIPIGAVAVRDGKVVSRQHNRVEGGRNACSHAEMLVVNDLSARERRWRLTGITLYVTKEPCPMCTGALFKSRIKKVVIGVPDTAQGCLGGRLHFNDLRLYHRIEVVIEPLDGACEQLLNTYFQLCRCRPR